MNYLQATRVESVVSETTNQEYVRVTFRPVDFHPVTGASIFNGVGAGIRMFNPGKQPNAGDLFNGALVSFQTTPYQIDGREVTKITVAAMSDENPVELANSILKRNSASVLDKAGKPTVTFQTVPDAAGAKK